jgi:hypothetical protein
MANQKTEGEGEIQTVTIAPRTTSVNLDVTNTALLVLDDASPAAHTRVADSVHPSNGPFSSETSNRDASIDRGS